jgi:uncharacterized protein
MELDLGWQVIGLLVAAATLAGFVDAIAGGGGLITVPALLLAGLDPVTALATNKVQGTFGSGSATLAFARSGHIPKQGVALMVATTFMGAVGGVATVNYVPESFLRALLPVLLVAIALYFALKPNLREQDAHARMSVNLFAFTFAFLIGFYDGVFGPGTGSFFMLAFVSFLGFGLIKATAHTKLLNFTSNIASVLAFSIGGDILWKIGLLMGVGQFIGAQLGSHMAMRFGAKIIRPLLVVVCVALAIRLMLDPRNPWRIWLGF